MNRDLKTFLNERSDYMGCHRTRGESNVEMFFNTRKINLENNLESREYEKRNFIYIGINIFNAISIV